MFVTIHALQSLPYSNLNRDREGAPKTCEYGGVVRARVSSQAWKRPIRDAIETELGASTWRTRRLAPKIADRLIAAGWNGDDARRAGRAVLDAAAGAAAKSASKQGGLRPDPDTDESNIMLWVADAALDELVALCDSQREAIAATPLPTPKKSGRKATNPSDSEHEQPDRVTVLDGAAVLPALETRNPVISLLGRFVAELPGSQVDGAVQMAHAISVNATTDEVDFFATVDDYLDDAPAVLRTSATPNTPRAPCTATPRSTSTGSRPTSEPRTRLTSTAHCNWSTCSPARSVASYPPASKT
ncbi:hypothetical protein BJF85_25305 [Saccharomonospora sp. CUA-673]|nr:hypothetical protein BJF85_25305 [Saccharomonospora sp. CUA-673]